MSPEEPPFHAREAREVAEGLGVRPEEGLSAQEVERRRREHGPNRLREAERRSALRILLDQFRSTVIVVLLIAGALAAATAQWPEAAAIAAVLLVNAAIGFTSEWRARRSMEALRELARRETRVRRDGAEQRVPVDDLVPGDVVLIGAEDVLPADVRLLAAEGLRIDEASLTGESVPVDKSTQPVEADRPLAERPGMAFRGTTVVQGSGEGVACATGGATELGRIAAMAEEAEAAETPLEKRLDRLGRRLAFITLAVAALIAGVGLLSGKPTMLMLETAVALAVAAIPEGLPIVATLALARGMWLMARRQTLINRLSAVETLGATRVIFTDKTGTLTQNRMTLRKVVTPAGEHELAEGKGPPEDAGPLLRRAVEIGVLCNAAALAEDGDPDGATGDPTEVALLAAGADLGMERERLLQDRPEVRRVDFDPDVMMMATFHRRDGGLDVAVKGAPAAVLEACTSRAAEDGEGAEPFDAEQRKQWLERARRVAGDGLRLLAVADKRASGEGDEPYADLRLVGLLGLLDPPREGVREAIEACRGAGIEVRVVTGDQPETAAAIAAEVGIGGEGELVVMHGRDLGDRDGLSEAQRKRVLEARIYARLSPAQKLDLIEVFQDRGEIVAMTGDGVNDAPALKKADIGIAMGRRGTDAARQVSDMILQDDSFSSIEAAVAEGRVIFGNIRKSVLFMLCTNVAEVLAVAFASLAAVPLPIRPLQILYLNVLTDVFPALALGVGPGAPDVMQRPPRDPHEGVLTRSHWLAIGGWAGLIAACVLAGLGIGLRVLGLETLAAVTVSFLILGLAKLWFVFNLRDPGSTLRRNDVVSNPWIWGSIVLCIALLAAAVYVPGLSSVLETRRLDLPAAGVVLGLSLVPMLVGQALRAVQSLRARQGA